MIQLYDYYHQGSQDLHYSLRVAGHEGPVVVINDDGFLPADVTSPYTYFCQMRQKQGKALYFNQLPVPEFWEIRGTNANGEVWEYGHLRAKIFYAEPKHHRLIKTVDWYDEQGQVKLTEHYNQYGWCFATTMFTSDQKISLKTYYNAEGQEVLVENVMTGDIILNWQGQTQFFANRVELLDYYFGLMNYSLDSIVYNSLSTPFFYSYGLQGQGQDYLFWQEGIGDSLPGNMSVMLRSDSTRTQKILVQDRQTYDKMVALATVEERTKIAYLGLIYPDKKVASLGRDVLILTNSDQLEQLDYLTNELPDFTFHIAALTEMSQRLMAFEERSNVKLYPNVSENYLTHLYATCQIYLDINQGSEVLDALRRAFEYNLLILGFNETRHQFGFGLDDHFVASHQADKLVQILTASQENLLQLCQLQRECQADVVAYHQVFD